MSQQFPHTSAHVAKFHVLDFVVARPGGQNALDWLVGSGELYEKPVALLFGSPRANYAQASLMETLRRDECQNR